MWSSAIASSSPVLTPGRTAARDGLEGARRHQPGGTHELDLVRRLDLDHASTPLPQQRYPLQDPGCHGAALSRPSPGSAAALGLAQRGHRPRGDLLDRAHGVDPREQALRVVEPRQRRRLFPVDRQPVPHGLGLVVVALHPLAVDEHAPAGQPPDQFLLVDHELQHAVEPRRPARPASCAAARPAAMVRGKPSSRKPALASGSASRSFTIATVISSGTRSPASM